MPRRVIGAPSNLRILQHSSQRKRKQKSRTETIGLGVYALMYAGSSPTGIRRGHDPALLKTAADGSRNVDILFVFLKRTFIAFSIFEKS